MLDTQAVKHRNRMLADGRVEKTVALIRHAAEIADDQQQRHAELFADREQAVTRHIDAGVFHVHRRLFAAERRPGGDGDRLLLVGHRDQFHIRIVANQRHDLAQSRLRQVSNEIDPGVFETLNESLGKFVFHTGKVELAGKPIRRNWNLNRKGNHRGVPLQVSESVRVLAVNTPNPNHLYVILVPFVVKSSEDSFSARQYLLRRNRQIVNPYPDRIVNCVGDRRRGHQHGRLADAHAAVGADCRRGILG